MTPPGAAATFYSTRCQKVNGCTRRRLIRLNGRRPVAGIAATEASKKAPIARYDEEVTSVASE